MKKAVCLLVSVLLLTTLFGCAKDKTPAAASDTPSAAPVQADNAGPAETEAAALTDSLPEKDYNGADFTIWANNARWCYFVDADMNGDIVNDAVFERNAKIADRFNINFAYDLKTEDWKYAWSDERKQFEAGVLAGDGAFDLCTGFIGHSLDEILQGYYLRLDGREYLDLEKQWWMTGINSAMTVGGKQYSASGYYEMPTILRTDVVFFSSNLAAQFGYTDLYGIVDAGEWTYDNMISMAETAGADLDGDGKFTQKDQYGLSSFFDHIGSTFTGTGYDTFSRDADGYLTLNMPGDALYEANEMLYKLTYESDFYFSGNRPGDNTNDGPIVNMFTENRSLFFMNFISYCSDAKFREMGDYGILPVPKFTAEQDRYGTWSSPFSSLIPIDVKDPEMSAIILEALEFESYVSVRPAYYDTALSHKYLNDEHSLKMLDVIFSNVRIDTGYLFGLDDKDYYLGLTENFASQFASHKSAIEEKIKSVNDAYRELGN